PSRRPSHRRRPKQAPRLPPPPLSRLRKDRGVDRVILADNLAAREPTSLPRGPFQAPATEQPQVRSLLPRSYQRFRKPCVNDNACDLHLCRSIGISRIGTSETGERPRA